MTDNIKAKTPPEREINELIGHIINLPTIRDVVKRAQADSAFFTALYKSGKSPVERVATNALWCLTHLQLIAPGLLQPYQDELIDMLLTETHPGRKRLLLQLLKRMDYDPESIRTDFLDYCFSKINSECEPYAVRAFSIYCALRMCRHYSELIGELEAHLDLLSAQSLSPGLQSALRTTRRQIQSTLRRHTPSH